MVKVVCCSDLHGEYRRLQMPAGDVLVVAGDLTRHGRPAELVDFNRWLGELPHADKVVIAGNHDAVLAKQSVEFARKTLSNAHYLLDSETPVPEPAVEPEAPDGCPNFRTGTARGGCSRLEEWTPRCSSCMLYSRDDWLLEQRDCNEWNTYECEWFIETFGWTIPDEVPLDEIRRHAEKLLQLLQRVATAGLRRAAIESEKAK